MYLFGTRKRAGIVYARPENTSPPALLCIWIETRIAEAQINKAL